MFLRLKELLMGGKALRMMGWYVWFDGRRYGAETLREILDGLVDSTY